MNHWTVAGKNLLRNRRRSISTLLALAIGGAALLLFGGYIANIRYTMQTAYVRNGGHIQIQHQDFFLYGNGNPTAYGIEDYEKLLKIITQDPLLASSVRIASPTLQFVGIAGNYNAGVSRTILGLGYIAEDVQRMRQWNEFEIPQISPPFLIVQTPDDSAMIGRGVARVLLLCSELGVPDCPKPIVQASTIGNSLPADVDALANLETQKNSSVPKIAARGPRIELLATSGRGSPNVASLHVVAAEDQGFKELDEVLVVLHLAQAQRLVYGRTPPRATSIILQLHQSDSADKVIHRLNSLFKEIDINQPLVVRKFQELNPFYVQSIQLFNTLFGFIFLLIGGVVLFTVSNTMNASVVERTVEIGTLRAIGLRERGVRYLFLSEGTLLGALGAITGAFLAIVVSALVNAASLTWLPPGSSTALPLRVRIFSEPMMVIGTVVGLVVIAVISAWWPAYKAARLNIVEALRHT